MRIGLLLLVVAVGIAVALYLRLGVRIMDSAIKEKSNHLARLRGQTVVFGLSFGRAIIVERTGQVGAVYEDKVILDPGGGKRKRSVPLSQIRWMRMPQDVDPRWGPW